MQSADFEPIENPIRDPIPTPSGTPDEEPEAPEFFESPELSSQEALPEDAPVEDTLHGNRKKKRRGIFLGLGILLVLAAAVVVLIRVLNVHAAWEDGHLVIRLFGADTAVVASAVKDGAAPAAEKAAVTLPQAPLGSGVNLTLSPTGDALLSLQELYRKVSPSVVSLAVTNAAGESGSGSGIIMTADGYVLTNHHVISGAAAVTVETADGAQYEAALVGSDEFSDLAVLKLEAENLPAAEFSSSANLVVGDTVAAIGDPMGIELRGTLTDGIISAINRDIVVGDRTMTLLQTNAALNAGNSGGPLIDLHGQVVGINTMKLSSDYVSVEGLGFAIPTDVAKPLIDELIDHGYVAGRPALGITCTAVAAQTSFLYDVPAGIYVNSIDANAPAAQQGLREGDIIIAIEGAPAETLDQLNTVKNDFRAGDTVHLTVWREGEQLELGVTLIDQVR